MTFESASRRVGNRSYQVVSAVELGTILGDNGNLDNYLLQLSNAVAVFLLVQPLSTPQQKDKMFVMEVMNL